MIIKQPDYKFHIQNTYEVIMFRKKLQLNEDLVLLVLNHIGKTTFWSLVVFQFQCVQSLLDIILGFR